MELFIFIKYKLSVKQARYLESPIPNLSAADPLIVLKCLKEYRYVCLSGAATYNFKFSTERHN